MDLWVMPTKGQGFARQRWRQSTGSMQDPQATALVSREESWVTGMLP